MAKKPPAKGPASTPPSGPPPPPPPDYSGAVDSSKTLLKTLQQLNNLQGKVSQGAKNLTKEMNSTAKEAETAGKSKFWSVGKGALDGMVSGTKLLGKGITATLGPLAAMAKKFLSITSIVSFITNAYQQGKEAAMKFSTQNTELARTMGLAQGEASKLAGEARSIGAQMGITNDQAVQAMGQIYSALGSTEKLSKNTLETFMKLSVFAGVSADTLADLAKTAKISGQDAGEFANAVADTSLSFIKANKMAVSMKSVMEGVSKVSASVKLTLGGSAEAITKAVLTSKKLGMELQKVEDIANGFLNLEDSIAAEMEAELLTGKDLNLEKAKEAALNNDNVALMNEIQKNIGSAADFAKMNRVQQEAAAKAVGMSREELAQTLANQKAVVAESGTLVDNQQDGAKAMESNASMAEQYQRRQEGIAAAFMGIFKALEPIVLAFQTLATKLAPPLAQLLSSLVPIIIPIVDLIAQLVDMFAGILKELIPPIISIIQVLVEAVKPLFDIFMDIMRVILPPIKSLLEALVPVLQAIFAAFQPFFEAIGELVKTLVPILVEIMKALLPVIQSIFEAIAPILTQFTQLITDLLPVVQEIIMGIVPIINLVVEMLKPFLQIFMDLLSQILPPILGLLNQLIPIIQQIFQALKPAFDALAALAQQLIPIIVQVLNAIIPVVLKIVESLTPIFNIISELAQAFMPIILDIFNAIAPAIVGIMEALMPIIDLVMMIIKPILDLLKPVLVVIAEIIGFIVSLFAKMFGWVGPIAKFIGEQILGAVNMLSEAFNWMYENVLAPIGDFFEMIYDFIVNQIMGAVDALGGAFSFIGEILSSVGDSITSVFVTAINWVIEAINWFIDGINSALTIKVPDWMGGGEWSPDLPKLDLIALAEGGIVSSPTTALIGEAGPEAVIPLDRFHDIMSEAFAPVVQLLTTMVEANKVQTDTLVAINEKEATINLDGNKIGEALVTSFSGLF